MSGRENWCELRFVTMMKKFAGDFILSKRGTRVPYSLNRHLLSEAEVNPFDLVILDIEMPGINGYAAAVRLRSMQRKPLVIFLTNNMAYTLRGYGVAFRYLTKPIQPELLHFVLDAAIREIQANRFIFQRGLSHSTIANIFKRNTVPSIDTLESICKGFGITSSQLFAGEEEVVELTPDLKVVFDCWITLSPYQKDIALQLLEIVNNLPEE